MLDVQIWKHFKEAFPQNIEAQLPEINDTDIAVGKTRALIWQL